MLLKNLTCIVTDISEEESLFWTRSVKGTNRAGGGRWEEAKRRTNIEFRGRPSAGAVHRAIRVPGWLQPRSHWSLMQCTGVLSDLTGAGT